MCRRIFVFRGTQKEIKRTLVFCQEPPNFVKTVVDWRLVDDSYVVGLTEIDIRVSSLLLFGKKFLLFAKNSYFFDLSHRWTP